MPFPLHFDPTDWSGPRARQYSERADAFQQLVGDLLREQFGLRASVSPTEGRDGSIDAFVDKDTSGSIALADLPAPQIIECKDHDDTRKSYLTNVTAGWSSVAKKLQRQAALGWPGHFQPWLRARSYAYCVSAVLPNQTERDKLHRSIADFFAELPESQRPPLENIHVFDWSDLRDLFDRLPRVADRWLGTGLPLILSHAEFCSSLTQFRRYLLPKYLPFVEPETGTETGPQAILARLEAIAGSNGVVIKGMGGIGKTRTALEVGHLADAKGWRVLHALPGEPGVTVEDLVAALLLEKSPTLLVFDYLDQMTKLDLGSLRKRLLPEAEKRGVRLALLANLRPSSLRRPNAERDALFTEDILLQPSVQQKSKIAELTLDRVAPIAVAQLGRDRVRELCGERPIIAILIAEELQRRAQDGSLVPAGLIGFRSGDLLGWLRRRLSEDNMVVDGGNGFLPPQPEPSLIAAAAMLAAAPLHRDDLEEAGRAAFQEAGEDGAQMAGPVLAGLLDLGWLEPRGPDLAAAHDVVADEVLTQVLWDRASGRLRDRVLTCCLAPALGSARVLGRYATALTRILGPEAAETEAEAMLREKAGAWIRGQGARLGEMLASAEVSESAFAMGGVLSAPAWVDACVDEWNQIVAPWLTNHGTHAEARHLLYKGLKDLPMLAAPRLLVAALDWLPQHIALDSASYVLAPLIARTDLGDHAPRAINLALAWLEKFPLIPETKFVFNPLLARTDLGDNAPRVINLAMAWLEKFPLTPETRFVFKPLLARIDLGDHAPRAINYAMAWLEKFPLIPETEFVFNPLLTRTDLGELASHAINLALAWLEKFPLITETTFVFQPLLARTDLGDHAPRAINYAMAWLEKFPLIPDTQYVFQPLLTRTDLGDHAPCAINLALAWLEKFPLTPEAQFVFTPLLARPDLGEHVSRAIKLAIAWLEKYPQVESVEFVLRRLFGHRSLNADQRARCLLIAVPYLERLGSAAEASYLLRSCLRDRELRGESERLVMQFGLGWMKSNPQAEGADFVFNRLLPRPALRDAEWKEVSDLALDWIRCHKSKANRDLSLASLLKRPELLEKLDLDWVLEEARQWLTDPPKGARTPNKLLKQLDYFHRRYDLGGKRFPIAILERWPRPVMHDTGKIRGRES